MAKILIVEDEVVCSMLLQTCLSDSGHEVKTAIKGKEAIMIGGGFRPDVLVSDWVLEDKQDGLDVATALTTSNPELKVIFFSGRPTEELETEAKGIPVFRIFQKPCDLDDILGAIDEALVA